MTTLRNPEHKSWKRQIPLLRILSEKAISGDGNGAEHRILQNKRWHQVIVPDPQGVQYDDGDDNRLHKRKNNPEKGTIRTASIYS